MRVSKEFPYKVRLWVPAARSAEHAIIRRKLVRAFGGLTETTTWGYWTDDNGNVVGEPVAVLEVFHSEEHEGSAPRVFEEVIELLLAAGETEVLLELNNFRQTYRA